MGPTMSPFGKAVRTSRGEKGEVKTENPRCGCGGMFPLDRSKTGERICAACYAEAARAQA